MLKILLLLLMGMTVDGATFCESYHQSYTAPRSFRDPRFKDYVSVNSVKFFNSSLLNFNWNGFKGLKLGGTSIDIERVNSKMDDSDCVMTIYGDSVLHILSHSVMMENVLAPTTVISQCPLETLKSVCLEMFKEERKCVVKDECVEIGAGKRFDEPEILSLELCSKNLVEFFKRPIDQRSFDVLEMGLFVDSDPPQLIDLTGNAISDYCQKSLNLHRNYQTFTKSNLEGLLDGIWPILRRFELDKGVESVFEELVYYHKQEVVEYICERVVNGIYKSSKCDWEGPSDLSIISKQINLDTKFGHFLNSTLHQFSVQKKMRDKKKNAGLSQATKSDSEAQIREEDVIEEHQKHEESFEITSSAAKPLFSGFVFLSINFLFINSLIFLISYHVDN